MKRKPRFKNEKVTQFVLLIGKIVTVMILTMLTYPFILFLAEEQISQETWFLYLGGTVIGLLYGKMKLKREINKRIIRWIMFLSCLTMMFVVNLLMNIEEKAMVTILGLLGGIPVYASIKFHFRDLEEEIKEYYHNNGYKHSL